MQFNAIRFQFIHLSCVYYTHKTKKLDFLKSTQNPNPKTKKMMQSDTKLWLFICGLLACSHICFYFILLSYVLRRVDQELILHSKKKKDMCVESLPFESAGTVCQISVVVGRLPPPCGGTGTRRPTTSTSCVVPATLEPLGSLNARICRVPFTLAMNSYCWNKRRIGFESICTGVLRSTNAFISSKGCFFLKLKIK